MRWRGLDEDGVDGGGVKVEDGNDPNVH